MQNGECRMQSWAGGSRRMRPFSFHLSQQFVLLAWIRTEKVAIKAPRLSYSLAFAGACFFHVFFTFFKLAPCIMWHVAELYGNLMYDR